jgi:hypothetical protein
MFGRLFGRFSLSLGDFLTKTSGHPDSDSHSNFKFEGEIKFIAVTHLQQ